MATESSYSMWAVKKACQSHNIPCSVIGYNESAVCIYSADDKVTNIADIFHPQGGTEPTTAMSIASRVLAKSQAKHKILFAITDGDWAVGYEYARHLDEMHKNGVKTILLALTAHAHVRKEKDGTFTHEPDFPAGVTQPYQVYAGNFRQVKAKLLTAGYGFSTLILVLNVKDLAKVISKTIVKGVVQSR